MKWSLRLCSGADLGGGCRFLNRESFKICEIDQGNDPALTQNVRLLRDQPAFDGWDDVCCLRGTQRGTYVKKK